MDTQQRTPVPDPEARPWLSIQEAGAIFGLRRAASYEAANRGDLPTIRMGRRRVVPTAMLRAKLGLDGGREAS